MAQDEGRLWIRLYRKHRVERDMMAPCDREHPREALLNALPGLDLSQPVWMKRHEADWARYAMTRFKPEHFMEPVAFDFMEICYIYGENEARDRRDRNILEDV